MSKTKTTTIIAVVIFVGLVGLLLWQRYQARHVSETTQASKDFVSFDVTAVTDITIVQGEVTTTLHQEADHWVVTSQDQAAADSTAITALLNTLNTAQIQATVSTTETNLATYGLDEATKTHITVQSNGVTVADVAVGKAGSASRTWYGQSGSVPPVYLLSGTHTTLVQTSWLKPADAVTDAASQANVDVQE